MIINKPCIIGTIFVILHLENKEKENVRQVTIHKAAFR